MNAIARLTATEATRAALTADAAAILRTAVAMQGPPALANTRDHAAHHEAGHAIQHAAEGHHVLGVGVYRRGADWLGGVTVAGPGWRIDSDTDPRADLVRARVLLAGPLAEWLHCASPALGAGVDEIALARGIVASVACKLSIDPEALHTRTVCEVIETFACHRHAFNGLAAALMVHRKVKGFQLLRLLENGGMVNPPGVARCGQASLKQPTRII
ncbi:hypothetical protein [uncultured Thiodictyon sp.]|uniref:hypothetical protein n=1 Tax=uncultured Thiodictyon sp. TaxID=1846217 RepID=UPI0025F3E22E|nr:hypothetical protein [uncultured Thiodictyon sp.]